MIPIKSSLALSLCLAGSALAPAAASAATSHAVMFHALGGKVTCGVKIHPSSQRAREVLCSARGIPAPKGPGDGGFVQIASAGAPQPLRLSQDSFAGGSGVKLGTGGLWSQLGVSCQVAKTTVMCFNKDNHGFVIGNGHYRSF